MSAFHFSKQLFLLFVAAFIVFSGMPTHAMAQSRVLRTIDNMDFRGVAEDDPLLGKRFSQKQAFYSIRPPADWQGNAIGDGEKPLQYAVRFKDPKTSDFMSLGLIQGGPQDLTIEGLSRFRGDFLGTVRKKGLGQIVGSDLFHFSHYNCLQVIAKRNKTVVLQLLIFDQPGSFLQLAYSMDQSRYHHLARAMEASIASLEWPNFETQK
ncbi:MAG TPA: hypothetical protein VJ873_10105 [bacterium]|nr:hypothetical protein [bacterium]